MPTAVVIIAALSPLIISQYRKRTYYRPLLIMPRITLEHTKYSGVFTYTWKNVDKYQVLSLFELLQTLMVNKHCIGNLYIFIDFNYNDIICITNILRLVVHTHPLSLVPLGRTFSTPPRSMHKMAFLMKAWPWMLGAIDLPNRSKIFLLFTNFRQFLTSSREINRVASLLNCVTFVAIRMVLKKQNTQYEIQ